MAAPWIIVNEEETATFIRLPLEKLQDNWYTLSLGLVEKHTGWYSLNLAQNLTEYIDGSGTAILAPKFPINSVTSIAISGLTVPPSYYMTSWNKIDMRSYVPDISYELNVNLERQMLYGNIFQFGLKNIAITYNAGGIASLPGDLSESLRTVMLLVIKELSVVPRTEGSDSTLKRFRPDRTLNPEEVLLTYGLHGKIKGILSTFLPKRKVFI